MRADISAADRARTLSPFAPGRETRIAWSSADRWTSAVLERVIHERLDTAELVSEHHCLVVHASSAARVEHRIGAVRREFVALPGNIGLIPSGAPCQFRSSEQHQVLVFAFSPDLMARAAGGNGGSRDPALREHHELRDRRIENIVRVLDLEVREGCPSGALYGESLALALATYLRSRYCDAALVSRGHRGGLAPKALRRVIEYVQGHLSDDLRLSQLAGVAGLSEHRFAHNFRASTGSSPHRYVTSQRIERAKRMLRETETSVTDIAYTLGFSSPSRFSSVFGQWVGVTPSRYRRAAR